MENRSGLLKILLVFCIVWVSVSLIFFFYLLKKTESEFNQKRAVLVKENLELKDKFESLQQEISEKMQSLDTIRKEKELFEERLSLVKKETAKIIESYVKQLEEIKSRNVSYRKKIFAMEKKAKGKVSSLQHIKQAIALESNKDIKDVLEDTLNKMESIRSGKKVSLEPIIVEPAASGSVRPEMEKTGKVLSIDPKNSLFVISLGRKDDIREGDRCRVINNGSLIAKSEIVSVRNSIAAAYIVELQPSHFIDEIKEGISIVVSR